MTLRLVPSENPTTDSHAPRPPDAPTPAGSPSRLGSCLDLRNAPRFRDPFKDLAFDYLEAIADSYGSPIVVEPVHRVDIYLVDAMITTSNGDRYLAVAEGAIAASPTAGFRDPNLVEQVLARCYGLCYESDLPVIVITSHLPSEGTQSSRLLAQAGRHLGARLCDVVATNSDFNGARRMQRHFSGAVVSPEELPWRRVRMARRVELFPAAPPFFSRPNCAEPMNFSMSR